MRHPRRLEDVHRARRRCRDALGAFRTARSPARARAPVRAAAARPRGRAAAPWSPGDDLSPRPPSPLPPPPAPSGARARPRRCGTQLRPALHRARIAISSSKNAHAKNARGALSRVRPGPPPRPGGGGGARAAQRRAPGAPPPPLPPPPPRLYPSLAILVASGGEEGGEGEGERGGGAPPLAAAAIPSPPSPRGGKKSFFFPPPPHEDQDRFASVSQYKMKAIWASLPTSTPAACHRDGTPSNCMTKTWPKIHECTLQPKLELKLVCGGFRTRTAPDALRRCCAAGGPDQGARQGGGGWGGDAAACHTARALRARAVRSGRGARHDRRSGALRRDKGRGEGPGGRAWCGGSVRPPLAQWTPRWG